jgi:acetyl esterase/lipase
MMRATLVLLLAAAQESQVKVVKDLAYYTGLDADEKKHKLDLYLPATDKPFPVLMWIHGGAWTMGDRAMFAGIGERFAERGIGCAVISYRLSPGVKHPEHVKDCARAFAWLRENIKKHGGDPDRLFVSGQSAGGHLAALLALDRKYLDELKVPEDALKGAVPMSGLYMIFAIEDAKGPLTAMFPKAFGTDKEVCRDASPMSHLKDGKAPPMLVITESKDPPVRAQMKMFQAAAEKDGLKSIRFADAEDRTHLTIVTKMMAKGDDPVRAMVVDFVQQRCKELDGK